MNTANYLDNGNSKYPLSTDALDFIQEQIKLIYNLSDLHGRNYILRAATNSTDGVIVIDGEVMPLKAGEAYNYIAIREVYHSVTAAGIDFEKARTERYAQYTSVQEGDCLELSSFSALTTIEDLVAEIDSLKKLVPPKMSVQAIYGSVDCDSLTYGWVPAGWFRIEKATLNGGPDFSVEKNKWLARYGEGNVDFSTNYWSSGVMFLRINSVTIDDVVISIPDLSERFIVSAGQNYDLGDTGGANTVTLTAAQSGLPAHTHDWSGYFKHIGTNGGGSEYVFAKDGDTSTGITAPGAAKVADAATQNASAAHENRPPYVAMNYVIKIV